MTRGRRGEPEHGTETCYQQGCRREACRRAHREHNAERKAAGVLAGGHDEAERRHDDRIDALLELLHAGRA